MTLDVKLWVLKRTRLSENLYSFIFLELFHVLTNKISFRAKRHNRFYTKHI